MLNFAQDTRDAAAPSIGFGLERLSRPVIAYPRVSLFFVVALILAALLAASGLRFGDKPADIFRGEDPAYRTYEAYLADYADGAEGALILLDGDFSDPDQWAALREVVDAVEASKGVGGTASIFSIEAIEAVAGPSGGANFENLPDFDAFDDAFEPLDDAESALDVRSPIEDDATLPSSLGLGADHLAGHLLNQGRFLTPDLRSAVILVRMAPDMPFLDATGTFAADAKRVLDQLPRGMTGSLTGPAVVRLSIVEKMISQQPFLLGGGLVAGFVLGVFLLGRWSDAVIVALMPIVSILGIYGVFGAAEIEMTVLLNNLPLLVLALSFANSMHLVYAARRDLHRSDYAFSALGQTMAEVGPAVALSTLTTIIAFLSFGFSGSAAIAEFGYVGAAAVAGVFFSAMIVHPVTIWAALKLGWRPVPPMHSRWRTAKILEVRAGHLARRMDKARRSIALITMAVALVASALFLQVQPGYSSLDDVPRGSQTFALMERLDQQFGGTQSLHLPLPILLAGSNPDQGEIRRLQRAHDAAEKAFPGQPVYSAWTFIDWLGQTDRLITSTALRDMLEAAPAALRETLLSQETQRPALILNLPVGDHQQLSRAADRLERAVGEALNADLRGNASGLAVLSARRSETIIVRLSLSLAAAALGGALLAALAFRSSGVFFVTLLPNILPVLMVGAILFILGLPLQFASALAMTIALGIAVDDTVHVLNAYRKFRPGRSPRDTLVKTLREVGPVLLVTTLVLSLGLMPALFSWSPGISVFAAFAITTIAIALLADLVALPGLLSLAARIRPVGAITPRSQPR